METALRFGFKFLPKESFVINSVTYEGVFNQSDHRDQKEMGGFMPTDSCDLVAPSPIVCEIGDPCLLQGVAWRIAGIRKGNYFTTLSLVSEDAS